MKTNRRTCIQTMLALGAQAGAMATWRSRLAAEIKATGSQRRLIVLWMPGGPSQLDTFDLKPGHANGGPFKELTTSVPGMRFSEHLPELGKVAEHLSIIRGMSTKEGDHSRGTFLVRTGQRPGAPVRYPAFPAALAKELSPPDDSVPGYVSILPNSFINPPAFSAGFLGASREPLTVGGTKHFDPTQAAGAPQANSDSPADFASTISCHQKVYRAERLVRRRQFWDVLQQSYGAPSRQGAAATHDTVYRRAMKLAESDGRSV